MNNTIKATIILVASLTLAVGVTAAAMSTQALAAAGQKTITACVKTTGQKTQVLSCDQPCSSNSANQHTVQCTCKTNNNGKCIGPQGGQPEGCQQVFQQCG